MELIQERTNKIKKKKNEAETQKISKKSEETKVYSASGFLWAIATALGPFMISSAREDCKRENMQCALNFERWVHCGLQRCINSVSYGFEMEIN